MIKFPPFAITLFAQRQSLNLEKLAEGDPTEWTTFIVTLAILAAIVCFILFRAGVRWNKLAGTYNSLTPAALLGTLIGIVIPVLLVNVLGIVEYLLLVMLGAYLGAVLASGPSPQFAKLHAVVVASLLALWMAFRAYYVAVEKTPPGAIFPPWVFFVPAVFVATGLLAMLGGAILFGALASRQPKRNAKESPENESPSEPEHALLAAVHARRAALISLILLISLGPLIWQVERYAREHRILWRLNEKFSNTVSRSGRISIRVRWSQGEQGDSWWLEMLRIRLGGSRLPRITRLIGNKLADDESLKALHVLPNLSDLTLYETRITDAGLVHLQHLHNLRRIDLRRTSVTEAAVAALQKQLPQAHIKLLPPQANATPDPQSRQGVPNN